MKYIDVINLMNGGIQAISSRTLEIGDAYTVVMFKNAIKTAFNRYQEREEQMLKEAGIKKAQTFFKDHNALLNKKVKDSIDEGLITKNVQMINRFSELQAEAQKQEVNAFKDLSPLSFESWHILQECNKDIKTNGGAELLSVFEVDLEGILWKMTNQPAKPAEAAEA